MFSATRSQFRNLVFYAGVLLLGTVLGACTPIAPVGFEASGNADVQVATTTAELGYPGPEVTPTPTLPPVSHNSLIATPLPEERVVAGRILEIPEPGNDFPYTYLEDYIEQNGIVVERVFVQYQGQKIRLGDDHGSSNVEATTEKHITWTYHAHGDETNLPFKSGLYVYELRTGNLTRIADGWHVGLSELDSEWVLYISWENAHADSNLVNDTPSDVRPLLAYNISSGQTITLTTNLPVILGRGTSSFYSVSDNRAGWVEYDMQTQQYAIKVSNLDSGHTQTLKVPDLKQPRFFSISGDLAVWRDTYWHGYSLSQDALFTVPYAPPGWENSQASIMVIARNSRLEWEVRVNDKETRYFSAPVLLRGHGPTAWESLVIPVHQTVAPPTPPPLEGTPPTPYP